MSRPTPTEQRELNRRLRAKEAAELDPPEPPPVREEGQADPPGFVVPPQRLTITERDGTERVLDFLPDHGGAYLMIEYPMPRRDEPWVMEQHAARVGIASIASLELVDVEEA